MTPFPSLDRLERWLNEHGAFDLDHLCDQDDRREWPASAFQALNAWGLQQHYVPQQLGGQLKACEEVMWLCRLVARRDLTLAIAHGKTFLGCVSVWVAGHPAMQHKLSQSVLAGEMASLGLSEQQHGSDINANTCCLEGIGPFRLSGEKWLINNASRSRWLSLHVLSDLGGGVRSHSLILVDRHATSAITTHPIRPSGIRGSDLGAVQFNQLEVQTEDFIGERGKAFETLLRSLQISRTLCTSFSLGGIDALFTVAVELEPGLACHPVMQDLIYDHLINEVVAFAAARSMHHLPDELPVVAAIAKSLVPASAEHIARQLLTLLPARHFFQSPTPSRRLRKILRDLRIVSIFDGNTVVNLQAILNQWRHLKHPPAQQPNWQVVFNLKHPPAHAEFHHLGVAIRHMDSLTHLFNEIHVDPDTVLGQLQGEFLWFQQSCILPAPAQEPDFDLPRVYGLFYAAAACHRFAEANPHLDPDLMQDLLSRLLHRIQVLRHIQCPPATYLKPVKIRQTLILPASTQEARSLA